MEAPPLPSTAAELDRWSVYADALLSAASELGTLIALDLALGEAPTGEQLVPFHRLANRLCRNRTVTSAEWVVGHARTLIVRGPPGPSKTDRRTPAPISHQELAEAANLIQRPEYQRLEALRFFGRLGEHGRMWKRLVAGLPRSCRRIECGAPGTSGVATTLSQLPEQITELTIEHRDLELLEASKTLATLELRWPLDTGDAEALLRLPSSVSIVANGCVDHETRAALGGRVAFGRPGDLVLIEQHTGATTVIGPATLAQLQARFGIISAKAQLARSLPESWELLALGSGCLRSFFGGSTFVRRFHRWSFRESHALRLEPAIAEVQSSGCLLHDAESQQSWAVTINPATAPARTTP